MKKTPRPGSILKACALAVFLFSSFSTPVGALQSAVTAVPAHKPSEPVTFMTTVTGAEGSTYTGNVTVAGGIEAVGTFVMPTETHGMALHCDLTVYLPAGTIRIKMNCNMHTFRGRWQIVDGTGAYSTLSGNGSLVMPTATEEVLTGTLRWK